VLALLVEGCTRAEIAEALHISPLRRRRTWPAIRQSCAAHNRSQALLATARASLLSLR